MSSLIHKIIFKINQILSFGLSLFKKKILGRTACLGKEILSLNVEFKKFTIINQQKARIDTFCDLVESKVKKPNYRIIEKFIPRKDIKKIIKEQSILPWIKFKNYDFILMDTFSELTDIKFTHKKEGWSFCAHYSDVNHTAEFKNMFTNEGLITISNLKSEYIRFFKIITRIYPNKKIIVIHFSTALDLRLKYKERGQAILNTLLNLESKFPNLQNIHIPDSLVSAHELDNFPYHYANATNNAFLQKWKELDKRR